MRTPIEKRHDYQLGSGEATCVKCGKRIVAQGVVMIALTDQEECPGASTEGRQGEVQKS